jgi:hypothetical protein
MNGLGSAFLWLFIIGALIAYVLRRVREAGTIRKRVVHLGNPGQDRTSSLFNKLAANAWKFLIRRQTPAQLVHRETIITPTTRPGLQVPMIKPTAQPVVRGTVIWPTEAQANAGLGMLNRCVPIWKTTPALLIMKPQLAAIVSLREVGHTPQGFQLLVGVEDYLVPIERLHETLKTGSLRLGCGWNQPYMSFSEKGISAPYSFRLHFEHEGVARIRQLWASLPAERKEKMSVPGPWERCLDITEEKFKILLACASAGTIH